MYDSLEVTRDSDICKFCNGGVDNRVSRVGRAPPPKQYSSISIPSVQALDGDAQALMDAMQIIRSRCSEEEKVLEGALNALREHRAHEEGAMAQSLATIRSHRNLLAPVMRLPPEVLSQIFIFHAQLQHRWIEATLTSTHVCRRWRQIGLGCSRLWSYINYDDCCSGAWMATMIERSCSAPLSLVSLGHTNVNSEKEALVAGNMHRFESLHLDMTYADSRFKLFNQPVPLLQDLDISYDGSLHFAFPPEFLSGHAPNLRHIKIDTAAYIPWDSGLFENLVTLDVRRYTCRDKENDPGAPSFEMLLSALTRLPGLQVLRLRCCLGIPSTPSTMGRTRVNLRNLKELWVKSPLRSCTRFLRHIIVNATVRLVLKCSNISKERVGEFFTVFSSHLYAASTPIAQALWFACRDSRDVTVHLWAVKEGTEFEDSQNPSVKLNFRWEPPRSRGISHRDLTWACFAALASPQLCSFRISGMPAWDIEVWRRLAHATPGLQRLSVTMRVAELCEILCLADGQDQLPANCFLPELSYLELEILPWHLIPMLDRDGTGVLVQCLSRRARIGGSMPELVFMTLFQEAALDSWLQPLRDALPGIIVRVEKSSCS